MFSTIHSDLNMLKLLNKDVSSVDCCARASEDFRFEEIRYRTSCGWFPVWIWGFPVGGWGHVTRFSQSEARNSKMAALIAYLTSAWRDLSLYESTLTLTLTLTRSSTFVTTSNLGKYPRF